MIGSNAMGVSLVAVLQALLAASLAAARLLAIIVPEMFGPRVPLSVTLANAHIDEAVGCAKFF
ncbi:hypothetical protein FJV83_29220 [Mesorhizobium sp. WSM4307]|uniref:hypothetical protein n=1 Tax=unclassified Mesorhizobium TaxID=325217 RepID=UPI00115EE91C|nr:MULTISPECIES: hypothetical protein [unclassified Mesorhizobium]TRC73918.1 hypothetical protein FJV80_30085 [Mesorhizobium sp. WSM4310]TRC78147.1 hypothetical protein FJV81_11465 [Mesorhizobium sp. WSM4315]TRC79336.1 hypothetical protein FJV83_29220 [Mesorhizobium sp. WSM4307]